MICILPGLFWVDMFYTTIIFFIIQLVYLKRPKLGEVSNPDNDDDDVSKMSISFAHSLYITWTILC